MNPLRKPVLILQSERALTEITVLRDALTESDRELVEATWRGINSLRQQLLNSLTVEEEYALEEQ